ncbi:hypothetical protein H5201_09575 [Pseudoalteromonas sp. SG43-6]|uniref:hypothetical protein n=1 Tax=Pseudoalteromonas sp. SG43-6 TaxID=2760967 RepID=UPI0016039DFA|nr:hypothetical protein [Pseudoalteromonas sp. SG43-6]MBB1434557.1 hypothetical protein [Pseudoalteromonas sp. SG43-6]
MANNYPSNDMQNKLNEIAASRARNLEKEVKRDTGKEYSCSPYVSFTSRTEAKVRITTVETGTSCSALYEITNDGRWYCRHDWND